MIDFSASTAAFRGFLGPERPFSGAAGGFCPSIHQRSPRLRVRAFPLAVEGQRGEGHLFHGSGAVCDHAILPVLNSSELP